ncbi:queuosine precursor transporter [Halobacillus litoralis]|uniref:Probable queuosine precursor transporter n=1 Tax=Halobacillus litoralis TaxID=45668 RepID=A0A845DPD7_9BACI|nr:MULTISPECIES: queuosine precursor transporter [Halobacillus]MYL19370.1 queuosine precursor transporter [Halobacillus litoralis]MYL28514.1 queuosine precursor transporter [Halobacillus halophilus]MYL38054.1 queuosine precursor transporter [Halobacillus litoralis]
MNNEIIWLIFALINFILLLGVYRIFGRTGLFVWIGMATVVANIQVVKTIEIFGLQATLGNIVYGTAFLATDILNEKYGKKEAGKAVWLGFSSLLAMTIIMQGALLFTPGSNDIAQPALETLFGIVPRVAAGSLAAYLVSQYFDVWLYAGLKKKFADDKYLWIRNNGSTMISQLLDTAVFCFIAFYGVYPFEIWLEIFLTTYIIKFIVSALDTPFFYLAKKFPRAE